MKFQNFYDKKEFKFIKNEYKKEYKKKQRNYLFNALNFKNHDYSLNNFFGKYKFNYQETDNHIELINVNKFYKNGKKYERVLKNINLKLPYGKIICILGPSGSGKSTLLNIISGLITATFGDVIINNINLTFLNENQRTKFRNENISFVFQTYNLLPTLKARDNVLLGSDINKKKNKMNVDELMSFLEMNNHGQKGANYLSGGQQQRISISRALIKNPLILLADEPTGALDSDNSKKILKIFKEIKEKYLTTIFIVTHDPVVTEISDYIIHIKNGEIYEFIKK